MYQQILISTDGSDAAERAIPHAVDLADKYGATLHALFVVDTDAVDLSLGTEQVQRLKEGRFGEMTELEEEANRATGRIAKTARNAGVDVVESTTAGVPHKKIVAYADDHDIDLITMTCHGRSGVKRMLLGSVTERVVRLANMPVLVVDMGQG